MTGLTITSGLPRRAGTKYMEILDRAANLQPGECVQATFETVRAALTARASMALGIKRDKLPLSVHLRGHSVAVLRLEEKGCL